MVVIHYDEDLDECELKLRSSGSLDDVGGVRARQLIIKQQQRHDFASSESKPSFQDISFRSMTSFNLDPFLEPSLDLSTASNTNAALLLHQIENLEDCRKLTLVRAGTRFHHDSSTSTSTTQCYYVNYSFPVATLITILRKAKRMVCVELCRLRLVGNLEDFRQLALALEGQAYLQAFSLEGCRLPSRLVASTRQKALEPVVKALATCPCIVDVTLIADKPRGLGSLSAETVGFLGRSPSLQVLRLDKVGLEDRHIVALSEAVMDNKILHTLRLSCNLSSDAGSFAMVHLLQHNTTLQKLDLLLETVPQHEAWTLRIARALQSSSSLRHYNLDFDNTAANNSGHHDEFVKGVQEEVKESKALARELEFSSASLSNCPFIRLINRAIDAGLYVGNLACHSHIHHQHLRHHKRSEASGR
ncbi:expressed unknown protein [Seminavis robusta]|uniref:Uncharacterized protein n=1 Tax=Seminavis robusta TaxID=568900 RepID=A0A9N8HJV1_9STRA|nr:expressed unknown protein [Seminavis robusta]|eukprot:Sro574_g169190.1 n/a (417) ;mRNA; r:26741-27991